MHFHILLNSQIDGYHATWPQVNESIYKHWVYIYENDLQSRKTVSKILVVDLCGT